MSTRTILITGATSGIGAGLAEAYHRRGAQVIVSGRNPAALREFTARFPGMHSVDLDVTDADSIDRAAAEIAVKHPGLNTLINNAGVQRMHDFRGATDAASIGAEIETNLTGLILVTRAFLPLLQRQSAATLVNVTSGLALVPLVQAPVYSATKSAARAFTVALREQLRGSSVRVVELIPPAVTTELHRGQANPPPNAMPLEQFITEAMKGLETDRSEVSIGLARLLVIGSRVAPGLFLRIVNKARK